MEKLKSEYTMFRKRIFCQEIEHSEMKQFSDKVKQQLSSSTSERQPYEIISILQEMVNHNKSINTGAAPTIDTIHLFDMNLSLNQLQSLKRCILKLEYPSQILDSLHFLYQFMCEKNSNKQLNAVFFVNCKIINEILLHYKKTLKVKNEEYQCRSLEQIQFLIEYGKKNNSSLLIEYLENHQIDSKIKHLAEDGDTTSEIKEKCLLILSSYFSNSINKDDK